METQSKIGKGTDESETPRDESSKVKAKDDKIK